MEKSSATGVQTSNYHVKNVEPVMIGTDMRARLFTLAPWDVIPWHSHSEAADHYFVLQGELTVSTRLPEEIHAVMPGHNIDSRLADLISLPTAPLLIADSCYSKALANWIG